MGRRVVPNITIWFGGIPTRSPRRVAAKFTA